MNKKYPTFFLTWFNKFLRVPYPGFWVMRVVWDLSLLWSVYLFDVQCNWLISWGGLIHICVCCQLFQFGEILLYVVISSSSVVRVVPPITYIVILRILNNIIWILLLFPSLLGSHSLLKVLGHYFFGCCFISLKCCVGNLSFDFISLTQ